MKTMKSFLSLLAASTLLVACNSNTPEANVKTEEAKEVAKSGNQAQQYNLVGEGDEIDWRGYKTYADGSHYGTLQVQDGEFVVEDGKLTSGNFVIDMNSIHSVDLAEDKEKYGKLVGHLKSNDFFAVDSFPTAKFSITEVKTAPESDTTNATHHVSGNLTLRGITKNITIPAQVEMNDQMVNFSTPEFVIDRSKWNVKFRSTSFAEFAEIAKEKAIDNSIQLKVDLTAKQAAS
jgi:polyisoprenoid-binding protein YceI